jgi:ubiquinone/menaquinone biosynthesis C-methylase UbiE
MALLLVGGATPAAGLRAAEGGAPAAVASGHQHAGHQRKFEDPQAYTKSWDDPQRDSWQKPADLVAALGIGPGMAVADIGTGTGYLLPHLSRATGPTGQVFAADISPKMLEWVAQRARREGLPNVTTVTASPGASGLAAGSIDRAIMINVWHHVEDRARYAEDLRRALRPGGVVFIVEARPELKEEDGPPAHFRLPSATVIEQLAKAGLRARLEPLALERQYVVRGER